MGVVVDSNPVIRNGSEFFGRMDLLEFGTGSGNLEMVGDDLIDGDDFERAVAIAEEVGSKFI